MKAHTIRTAAALSAIAYIDELKPLRHALALNGLSYLTWHRTDDDTEFLICRAHHTHTLYVAIAGTESVRDVVTDVRALRRRMGIGKGKHVLCHGGGLHAAISIAGTIATHLRNFPFDDVILTGHSLGGMIARILRGLLPASYPGMKGRPMHCVTFGAPRSGCPKFADHLNRSDGHDIRVEHAFDPVPYVPGALTALLPRRWSRYCHAGQALILPSKARGIAAHRMSGYLADVRGSLV